MANSTITSPSLTLPGSGDALLLQIVHRAEFTNDETESFNEDQCLFTGSNDADDECVEGAFFHYSRRSARQHSVYDIDKPYASDSDDLNNSSGHAEHTKLFSHIRRPECKLFSSYDERNVPTSPDTKAMKTRNWKTKKSSLSIRESLLAEAWERKRELNMLNEEMANFKEKAIPELLGRSSSDCGKLNAVNAEGVCHDPRRSRTRSLTDDDFEELRGCIDLGFHFDQSSIPDLCEMLPALEVYCAVAQSLQESPSYMPLNSPVKQHSPKRCSSPSPVSVRSWKVSSPGDDPKDVKGRLRHWAQAVACDARLCC